MRSLPALPWRAVLLGALVALPLLADAARRPGSKPPPNNVPPPPAMGQAAPQPVPPNPMPPPPVARRHEECSSSTPGEEFRIAWDEDPAGQTRLKVLSPEGFGVRITDATRELLRDTIPSAVQVEHGVFYRVEVYDSRQVFFDRKFEGRRGLVGVLNVPAPGMSLAPPPQTLPYPQQPQQPVVIVMPSPTPAPAPAPPAPPPAPTCTPDRDFRDVMRAIEGEAFGDGKLGVLRSAAADRWFCSNQVIELVKEFSFSSEKLEALRVVNPRIADRQNNYKIIASFTFSHDKDEAKKILK